MFYVRGGGGGGTPNERLGIHVCPLFLDEIKKSFSLIIGKIGKLEISFLKPKNTCLTISVQFIAYRTTRI